MPLQKLLIQHKKFGLAQNILGPVKGQGMSPFTGPKLFWAGPNFLCQTKNIFTHIMAVKEVLEMKRTTLVYCLFKYFCAGTKTNFTEFKSSFCLAQNVCDCHNM